MLLGNLLPQVTTLRLFQLLLPHDTLLFGQFTPAPFFQDGRLTAGQHQPMDAL